MPYIVVFDDDMGLCSPMGWDRECEGALCYSEPVAAFHERADAQRAIRVSRNFAKLQKEQGRPANTDFLPECRHCIRVVKLEYPVRLPWQE